MKGVIYYEKEEAARNRWFIDELIASALIYDMDVELMTDGMDIPADVDFVLYRGRDFEKSRRLEQEGMLIVNRSEVNRIANDKLQTFQLAAVLGIPAIPTVPLSSSQDVRVYPVVVKSADGHGGADVHLCETVSDVDELLARYAARRLLAQPFIEHGASDVRLYVIGDEVIGAVRRTGSETFKSNVTLGGVAERFDVPPPLREFAERIARALKSDYIGVDFIQDAEGVWLLNELEDPVGARSLYETSEVKVAQEVMHHIYRKISETL